VDKVKRKTNFVINLATISFTRILILIFKPNYDKHKKLRMKLFDWFKLASIIR
jgi:hypothetical protein